MKYDAIQNIINNLKCDKNCEQVCFSNLEDCTLVSAFSEFYNSQKDLVGRLLDVGVALSSETRIRHLLEKIVDETRFLTGSDAGTLYTVGSKRDSLEFTIIQNDKFDIRMGGTSGIDVNLPKIPLFNEDGSLNVVNISAYCANMDEIINIADVYDDDKFDSTGPKKYDAATGYRSKSMLVLPLKNHEQDIIGVLQLLNALDKDGNIITFTEQHIQIVTSLASQAAVALTNAQLIKNLKELVNSVFQSIAAAIDAKSPYTNGHIERVVKLTDLIANKIEEDENVFEQIGFTTAEREELRFAAWMHDIGKISIPEHVIDKGTKLETIFDRAELVDSRFRLIAEILKNNYLEEIIEATANGASKDQIEQLRSRMQADLDVVDKDREFILNMNIPAGYMSKSDVERVISIGSRTYIKEGREYNWLTQNEVDNLCVRKGTITADERKIIESHAQITYEMLSRLPFPKNLINVPKYASQHHEKLNGTGYPRGLSEDEIPLQSRIIAIADVFEALTAWDRPYKKAMDVSKAKDILSIMCKEGHLDGSIVKIMKESDVCSEYAKEFLDKAQWK